MEWTYGLEEVPSYISFHGFWVKLSLLRLLGWTYIDTFNCAVLHQQCMMHHPFRGEGKKNKNGLPCIEGKHWSHHLKVFVCATQVCITEAVAKRYMGPVILRKDKWSAIVLIMIPNWQQLRPNSLLSGPCLCMHRHFQILLPLID